MVVLYVTPVYQCHPKWIHVAVGQNRGATRNSLMGRLYEGCNMKFHVLDRKKCDTEMNHKKPKKRLNRSARQTWGKRQCIDSMAKVGNGKRKRGELNIKV